MLSPCTKVCSIDAATGWCLGCARSLPEIAAWASVGDAEHAVILAALPARRAKLDAIHGEAHADRAE
ncbi:DUF1289 domain-containing protein [Sphingoaurantiacus capsulatus]|uniref:DUF1289 domain-containing protein n=1 Tax=Sphingoaurantiacus capsulatus TaxID=1771310 RepID=A0ABV7XBF1_9SPHN